MPDPASNENFKKAEELRRKFVEANNNYITQGTGYTVINPDGTITAYVNLYGDEAIIDEDATEYLNNVTTYDVNGNLVAPGSPAAKAIFESQVERKKQLDANKAATAIQGTNTVITSDAKVTDNELWSAAHSLDISIDAENDAKAYFDKNNAGMTTILVNHAKNNQVLTQNTNVALNSLNTVYPEPTSEELNQLKKYPTQADAEAHLSGDDLTAWKAANATVTKYNENKDFVDVTKNYYDQANSGNPSVLVNANKTIAQIDTKIANSTDADEIAELEKIKASVQSTDTNINDNPDVTQRKDAWNSSREGMLATGEERADREAEIRELKTKDGYEDAKNRQDAATQETLDNVRDIQDPTTERPIDDLNANAQAGRNKFIINNLTSTERGKIPFYLQLPTMQAITDFHLRNGFSPYGNVSPTDVARDALHFNIFEGALGKTKVETIPGTNLNIRVLKNLTEQTIGSFTIYPNQPDWLNLSHNHIYSDENPLAAWVNPVLQFVNTGGNILKAVNVVSGKLDVNERSASRVSRRLDFIDQYQATDKLQISVPFMLFTKGNFLQDIFSPLMFLTALSYPTRLAEDTIASDIRKVKETIDEKLPDNALANYAKKSAELAEEGAEEFDKLAQRYGNVGAFRYIVTRRPEYLSVRHASGLFYFKLASIMSFSYNFRGPWINTRGEILSENGNFSPGGKSIPAPAKKTFSDYIRSAGQFFGLVEPKAQTPPQQLPPRQIEQFVREKMPVAFPSIVECNLVVKSVEPMFREDWLGMLKATNDPSGQSLVRVSERLTGTLGPDGKPLEPINLEKSVTNANVRTTNRNQNSAKTGGQ